MKPAAPHPPKKLLVLGHDASRTGAPIFLLHLVRWLQRHGGMQMEIVLRHDGPLLAEFQAVAPTRLLAYNRVELVIHRLCEILRCQTPAWFSPAEKFSRHLRRRETGLIYANTVAVTAEAAAATRQGWPVLWQVHELPFFIGLIADPERFRAAARTTQMFVAVAECGRQGLMTGCGIPAEKISVIPGFVPPAEMEMDLPASRAAVRAELNLPPGAFVAGMCGTVCWHKGVDWFLAVARDLAGKFAEKEIHLLWIGAAENETLLHEVNHDLRQARLTARVKFIGSRPDSRPYLAALDAFFLSSRLDSFPLVMLEAAALGLPVVCFANSGGGPEFTGTDAGIVVNYADTLAAAQALADLSEQPERRRQLGANARQKVLAGHTIEIQGPKILALMRQQMK